MSKFRLISKSGDGLAIAHRIAQGGNDVDFWLKDPKAKCIYDGILPRYRPIFWYDGLEKDDVILVDMVGFGKLADDLRKQGYKVYGASEVADDLELKRDFGLELADQLGIEVPYSEDFDNFDDAITLVQKKDCAFVFKPEHNKEGVKTFVSQSPEQMIKMLEYYKDVWKGKVDFVMQEVLEGIEVSSEIWLCDGVVVPNSYNNTWECKRFLNGDYGPMTGCMSSTVKFNASQQLYKETFAKMEKWLEMVRYNGPLDINCIICDDKPYMLEFTARMGYSAVYAYLQGLGMEAGEYFAKLASGEIPNINPSAEWLGALRISIPPYPHCEDAPQAEGLPLELGDNDENIWMLDVMQRDGELYCSGYDGVVCEITDSHPRLSVLWDYLYMRADTLEVPEMQIRTDCFENADERIRAMTDDGWLEGD